VANSALTTKTAGQIVAGVKLSTAGAYSVSVENTVSSAQSTALSLTVGASQVPSVSYISPITMTANTASSPDATQTLYINGSNFTSSNVVQFYWTQGNYAYNWNNSKGTPTVTSTLITIPMNPGLVTDTINIRVCESASQIAASTCSSGTQSVAVTATVPTVPTGLAPGSTTSPGPTITTLTPTLTWNASPGATSYQVAVSQLGGGSVCGQNVTTNSVNCAPFQSGSTYLWTVAASNSAGSSTTAPIEYFTVNTATIPSVPTGLTPGSTSSPGPTITTLTPTLTWNASPGATSYQVAVSKLGGGSVCGQNVTTNSVSCAPFQSGSTYLWTVSASNSAGSSSTAPIEYFTVNTATIPVVPTGLAPGSTTSPGPTITTLTPTLTWNASPGATSYQVAVSKLGGGSVCGQNVTTNSVSCAPFQSGSTYLWTVAASNSAGSSSTAPIEYFTVNTEPSISGLNQPSYPASNTAQTMIITGSNFQSGDTLTFTYPDGSTHPAARNTTYLPPNQLSYQFNNENDPGPWAVTVNSPDGTLHSSPWPFKVQ